MKIQDSDPSAYAIVVVPELGRATVVSLYHWRHLECDWEPSEIELLYEAYIKPCPPIDNPDDLKRGEWVSMHLAPVLDAVGVRAPKKTTVGICLPETIAALTDYPCDLIDKYCNRNFDGSGRGVTFQRMELAGPVEMVLKASAGSNEYAAVYTVRPDNVLRIYECSRSGWKLIDTKRIEHNLNITEAKWLDHRVIQWVDGHLRPALHFPGDLTARTVQLFLPTKDLCANPHNTYNSVRDQIIRQLRANPPTGVKVTLAGTTDDELPLNILNSVFASLESPLLTRDMYLLTIEHQDDMATVFVDYQNATRSENIYQMTVNLNVPTEIETVLTSANASVRDNPLDKTLIVVQAVALKSSSRTNTWYFPNVKQHCGTGPMTWICRFYPSEKHRELLGRLASVKPDYKHAVVADAGSGGTRAFLYRWRNPYDIDPVHNPKDTSFRIPRLPFVKLVEEFNVPKRFKGIATLVPDKPEDIQAAANFGSGDAEAKAKHLADVKAEAATRAAAQVLAYLDRLFNLLDPFLADPLNLVKKADTPLFVLATGGMRSREKGTINSPIRKATYEALKTAINNYVNAKGQGSTRYGTVSSGVATGDEEAIYGWITANYAMRRLDNPLAGTLTKGFVEMGGASLQVAYEAPTVHVGPHMAFNINHFGVHREFKVYTREIGNLGAQTARDRYLEERMDTLRDEFTIDRCWPRGCKLAALPEPYDQLEVVGTGLCGEEETLTSTDSLHEKLSRFYDSLSPVGELLPRPLLTGGPPAFIPNTEFAGGSTFWHVSQGIYPIGTPPEHTFDRHEITNLIIDFATLTWQQHTTNVVTAARTKVGNMTPEKINLKAPGDATVDEKKVILINREVVDNTPYKSGTLFNAMLALEVLYHGIPLTDSARFQPYNGVPGFHALKEDVTVDYSWTVAPALISAIRAQIPAKFTPP